MNDKLMFRILNSKDSMYDLCENMEQVYDNFYEPLYVEYQELQKTLINNLSTIRELEKNQNSVLQQENQQLKEKLKCAKNYVITHTVDGDIRIMGSEYLLTILDLEGDSDEDR